MSASAVDTPMSNSGVLSQEDTTITNSTTNQNEEGDVVDTNTNTSITAVLEAANTIRKGEENDNKPTDNMNASSNNDSGEDTNITSTPPTIEDIANSLSEPNIMTYTPDDNNEDDNYSIPDTKETNNKPAYSSQTFTAISTLMSGKDTDLLSSSTDDNNNFKSKEEEKGSKEISLEDRAHAMISVYKDYILSEEEEQQKKKRTEDTDTLESNRKEEIKVQTLNKFCNNEVAAVHTTENDDYDSDGSDVSDDSHTLLRGDKYRIEKSAANSKKKQPKIKLKGPTSATVTAAFRLKAEVALKTVKKKVKSEKNTKASTNGDQDDMAATIENEFDFQDYIETDLIQNEREEDLEYGITQDDNNEQLHSNNNEEEEEVESGGIYGMHILDRDNSLKRRPDNDDDDEAAVGIFNDLCDELGVTPNTHPGLHNGLHHFYHQHRSTRYKYPIFRSKKFKLGILYVTVLLLVLLIGVAIISAITNGYENIRLKENEPPLPDWHEDDEWREKQKEDWVHDHPNEAVATGRFDTHPGMTSRQKLFQKVSDAYQPVWYDRSSGWTGQTYSEALTWCDSHDNYIPCPYEVYCPDQKSLILSNDGLSSLMDRDGESWAPVSNANNEWVEISSKAGACDLYSERYNGEHPEWGINGDNNEEITRHILCCREHPLQEGDESSSMNDQKADGEHVIQASGPPVDWHIFEAASKKYEPVWFGRNKGWKGQTYQESLDFCANQMDGYMPCPLDAYCPEGRGQLIGGIQDVGESWSAVIDSANDWVQVGEGGACNLYSETEKELPSWGITGENNEEITRHIMCCRFDPLTDNNDTPQSNASGPPLVTLPEPQHDEMGTDSVNTETDDDKPMSAQLSLTSLETRVQDKHHPVWFRSKGGSYDDAKSFCESMPSIHGKGTLHLCPLLAFCPNGPDTESKPLYLQREPYEGVQWAPISNGDNQWVMIGDIADLTCKTYASINHHPPNWGKDGSSPQLKEHILCCENNINDNAIATIQGDSENSVSDSGLQLGSISSTSQVDTQKEEAETSIINTFNPTWFDADTGGWTGGSHSEASKFCQQFEGSHGLPMQLCPYAAYCPHGPSHEVISGHDANFDEEGEQWAPVFGKSNHWVMIGKRGTNKSTTCLSHEQLTGEEPSWGLDWSEKEKKRHIMCCSPLQ